MAAAAAMRPGSAVWVWLAARTDDLLPVPYFHVVFTLPAETATIAFQNKAVVYGILSRHRATAPCTIASITLTRGPCKLSRQEILTIFVKNT